MPWQRMLSSTPPAVLPLISCFPLFCSHSHPPSARTRCTPTAPLVTLMDMAQSHQPSLCQETACSLQGWERAQQTCSVSEPAPPQQCSAWPPSGDPWSSEGPLMKPEMIPNSDRGGKKKKARRDRPSRPGIAFLVTVRKRCMYPFTLHLHHQVLFHLPPLNLWGYPQRSLLRGMHLTWLQFLFPADENLEPVVVFTVVISSERSQVRWLCKATIKYHLNGFLFSPSECTEHAATLFPSPPTAADYPEERLSARKNPFLSLRSRDVRYPRICPKTAEQRAQQCLRWKIQWEFFLLSEGSVCY